MSHFSGHFEGASTFLTPKLSLAALGTIQGSKKFWPPQNVPRNGSKSYCPKKKNYVPNFLKQRDIGNFMSFCNHGPSILQFLDNGKYNVLHPSQLCCSLNNIQRKPRENSSLGKNPPKYTTAYIVQQSNCRWHCEPTCFSSQTQTMKILFTSSLSNLSLYQLSISNPSISILSVSSS